MSPIDPILRGLESEVGALFAGLILFLLLFMVAYGILLYRKKQKDLYAYLYENHYRRAEEISTSLDFIGKAEKTFWGRASTVLTENKEWGICIIPPPEESASSNRERFSSFFNQLDREQSKQITPTLWRTAEEMIIHVQGDILDKKGRRKATLAHHLLDSPLSPSAAEQLLLSLAQTINTIHNNHEADGNPLYHGWILPRSIVVDLDEKGVLNQILLSDIGYLYSLSPERVFEKINLLKEGKHPIETIEGKEILEQLPYLAPELVEERHSSVGFRSDLYSFGAIATLIFTKQPFTEREAVRWESVPKQWVPFIQSCLERDPLKRPKDLLEIEEWLSSPELQLIHSNKSYDFKESGGNHEQVNIHSLAEKLQQIQQSCEGEGDLESKIEAAIQSGRWSVAKSYLEQKMEIEGENISAATLTQAAIVAYELEELDCAERYYSKAKESDPSAAKKFRQHIAFKI